MSDSILSLHRTVDDDKSAGLEVIIDEEEYLQRRLNFSRSVLNLGTAATSSFTFSPGSLNRSDSSTSLASNFGSLSPVPVSDIKNLNNNYQKLLKQATKEIKKLNLDVRKLELEQEKLLQENVDFALETKKLLLEKKVSKKHEQVKHLKHLFSL